MNSARHVALMVQASVQHFPQQQQRRTIVWANNQGTLCVSFLTCKWQPDMRCEINASDEESIGAGHIFSHQSSNI